MNRKRETLCSLKKHKLFAMCTLILSNYFHLTIGSRLILTQKEL